MRLMLPKTCFVLLIILSVIAAFVGLLVGPVQISPAVLFELISSDELRSRDQMIIESIRLPRMLLSFLIGAVLATCGAVMQGLFRNSLADPSLIGVSAGASAGASFIIVFGSLLFPSSVLGLSVVSIGAFVGGLVAAWIVYRLASSNEGTSVATMLLAGIAISALAGALNQLFSFLADNDMLRRISLWQMGSLESADWQQISYCIVVFGLLMILLPRESRALNAMLLGESEARHLGVGVEWLKRRLIIYTSLGVGVAVSVAGTIAFVGLVVPHLIRLLIGPDHRHLLPASALMGGLLLVCADAVSRVVVAPAELPIGVVTAILGVPFFISILVRQRGRVYA